jgi:hypothetical protein
MDEEVKKIQQGLEEKFKGLEEKLVDLRDKGAEKEEVAKCIKALEEQGKTLQDFIDSQRQKVTKKFEERFAEFIIEKRDEIKKIYKQGSGEIEFNPFADVNKAVADITTGSGTDEVTVPTVLGAQLGSFNLRNDNDLLNYASVTSTNKPASSYTEMLPKEGSYAFVVEGGTKPQIDFKWETRYNTPKKAAAYEILTEESVTDYAKLESVAREYLRKNHDLFKINGVYFSDGIGDNPTGATVYARTFVAGAMLAGLPAGTANIMDVINAAVTDIYVTHNFTNEASYRANVAMVSPIDFFLNFVAAKDNDGLPLYPSASLFSVVNIGGIIIRPWEEIPAGKVFVADMKKYHIENYVPFSIRIGWINDQFITNKFTMVGESRYFQYVKNLDQAAFIYDDIATIVAAIEAP